MENKIAQMNENKIPNHEEEEQKQITSVIESPQTETHWTASNGGLEAWLQVAAGFFLSMNSWGLVNTFGVYQKFYFTELLKGTSNSNISWIGSTQGFLLCSATVFAGVACDLGHTRATLFLGAVLVVLGELLTSFGTQYWHLILTQGVLVGLGSGCCFMASVAVLPQYFTTKRALAIGVSSSGSSAGGVIYPILFHNLQPRIGASWATRIIALIALLTLTFSTLTLRPRPHTPPSPTQRRKIIDLSTFADPPFTLFSLSAFLAFLGLFIPFFYIEQFASSILALSPGLAFYTLPLLSAGSFFGRILPSYTVARIGALSTLAICTGVSAMLAFCWFALTPETHASRVGAVYTFAVLYGMFSGAFVSLRTVVVVAITSEEQRHKTGARLGVNALCAALGLLVGTPIAGVLVRGAAGWDSLRGFCGGSVGLGACIIVVAAWVARRRRME